ncbi:MAG: hypothetical protein KGL39_05065 [Patescibacteria group bacterium]|nr:hypothetical protein [Patescibacteria group bacterium]
MSFYREYGEAFNRAVVLARLLKREVGLEKADNPLDGKGFRIFSLPNRENRYGHELRCQVVGPQEPMMTSYPPFPIIETD